MFKFGARSLERLSTCHADLQRVMQAAIEDAPIDFGIACGHRNQAEQDRAVADGFSKLPWPRGPHNALPSRAVDILPAIDGQNAWGWLAAQRQAGRPEAEIEARLYREFRTLRDHIWGHAGRLGVGLRWGGDWDGDGRSRQDGDGDEKFVDLPHFELRGG
jgi:peptidoglycan L-alanyl-D-glutamate endopeptidase CwlK